MSKEQIPQDISRSSCRRDLEKRREDQFAECRDALGFRLDDHHLECMKELVLGEFDKNYPQGGAA